MGYAYSSYPSVNLGKVATAFFTEQPMKLSWAPKTKQRRSSFSTYPYISMRDRGFHFRDDVLFSYALPIAVISRVGAERFYFINTDRPFSPSVSKHLGVLRTCAMQYVPEKQLGFVSFSLAFKHGIDLKLVQARSLAPYMLEFERRCNEQEKTGVPCRHKSCNTRSVGRLDAPHSVIFTSMRDSECAVYTDDAAYLFGKTRTEVGVRYCMKLERPAELLDPETLLNSTMPEELSSSAEMHGPWWLEPTDIPYTGAISSRWWKAKMRLPPSAKVQVTMVCSLPSATNNALPVLRAGQNRVACISVSDRGAETCYTFVSGKVSASDLPHKHLGSMWYRLRHGRMESYDLTE